MATQLLPLQCFGPAPWQCVRGDPLGTLPMPCHTPFDPTTHAMQQCHAFGPVLWQCVPPSPLPVPLYSPFDQTSHASLMVVRDAAETPVSGPVQVRVLNGSDGSMVPLILKSTDTIGKLQRRFLKKRPGLAGSLHLAYNGKPVQEHQRLGELGVKDGAVFITFQRCTGG